MTSYTFRRLAYVLACMLLAGGVNAQSTATCPTMPADSGLRWEQLDGPDFTFCKAIRDTDGSQAFAVMLGSQSPFRPNRSDRAEDAVIGGKVLRWYRSEVASDPNAIIRETLVELSSDRVAHITLQANSDEQKVEVMRQIEAMSFSSPLLSSN